MAPLRAQYIAQRTPFSRTSQTGNNFIILPEPEMLYARFLPCLNLGSLIFRGGQITVLLTFVPNLDLDLELELVLDLDLDLDQTF